MISGSPRLIDITWSFADRSPSLRILPRHDRFRRVVLVQARSFPLSDWEAISDLIGGPDPNAEWSETARTWLGQIAMTLGTDYQIHSSRNFLTLTLAPAARMRGILLFLEECHDRILESLPFADRGELPGKFVVIIFSNETDFYEYPDDGQRLSYHLARYLFNSLIPYSNPETMTRFIRSVSREDSGYSAALDVLGVDLEEVLAGLLAREPGIPGDE